MTPASSQPLPLPAVTEFADGFGRRTRVTDPTGDPLDVLRIEAALASAPGFDFALRERVNRLANFRHAYYSRVRRVDRPDSATLSVVSEAVEGARLSRILEVSQHFDLELDVNAALCLLRQVVPAVAMLHQNARDVSHGALSPERIVVTPSARIVLVEYVLGAAIESLGYSRERLWMDLRVAVPPGAGVVRMNHRTDVMQIGVVALALVLGRPLVETDLRDLSALLASATENTANGRQPISESLRRWLARALQLDPRGSFESALEAQLALDDVLSGDAGYVAAPVALESFLARFDEHAARMPDPAPVASNPEPVTSNPARGPVAVPREGAVVTTSEAEPDIEAEIDEEEDEEEADPLAFTRVSLPRPAPTLGAMKVSADAPSVPSFRAVPTPPVPASSPEPPAAAVEQPVVAPVAVPVVDTQQPVEAEQADSSFDEEALRAQFLAASGATATNSPAIGGWWRTAALVLALVALGEAGFIAWRFANSPSGLLGNSGTLKVESKPMGAQVKVDGEVKGNTPLSFSLARGAHVVEISAGGEPRVIPIEIASGQTLSQYVELAGIQTLGRLSIQSAPAGATVLIDGQPRGTTPLEVPDVPAGEHELVLDLNGQRTRQSVTVATGVTTTVDVPMSAPVDAAGMFPAAVPTTGTLLVQAPFEMQVFESGASLGLSGARLTMTPGPHTVDIVSDTLGFKTSATVEIVAGKTARVPVALPKGIAHLNATPWAEVWVDGAKVGDTPIGNLQLTVGPHEIVFKHPELGERSHAATVKVGEPLRLSVDLNEQR
jgi:hypothetical protein